MLPADVRSIHRVIVAARAARVECRSTGSIKFESGGREGNWDECWTGDSITRNVKDRQRESGLWHMAGRVVRGKSKGLAPAKRSGSSAGLPRQLKDRLRVPLQNSRPGTRKSKEIQQEAKQLPIQATYATGRILDSELKWSLEHNFEHLDPIIQFRELRPPPKDTYYLSHQEDG